MKATPTKHSPKYILTIIYALMFSKFSCSSSVLLILSGDVKTCLVLNRTHNMQCAGVPGIL